MNTIRWRTIACFAVATVLDPVGAVVADLTCQFPGGRPCRRTVPYNRDVRDVIEDAPICNTLEDFENWVTAHYGATTAPNT